MTNKLIIIFICIIGVIHSQVIWSPEEQDVINRYEAKKKSKGRAADWEAVKL